jgi:AcrR family transcriptional regulator
METLPGHLDRLPAGQDKFQAELISKSQRERILDALAETVAKRGYQGTSVELIVKRAGVARVTFYENFENREACLLACFEEAVGEVRGQVLAAAAKEKEWSAQVRAGLATLLEWIRSHPALARTCLVETVTAGPAALGRYELALESFAPPLRRGREFTAEGALLPPTLEDSIVGGIVWMIHQRLLRGEAESCPALLPTMLRFSLSPYLGEERVAQLAANAQK